MITQVILFPKSSLPLVFPIIEVAQAKILGLVLDFSFPYPKYIIYQQSSRLQIHLKSVYFSYSLHTSTTHHYLFRILQEPPKVFRRQGLGERVCPLITFRCYFIFIYLFFRSYCNVAPEKLAVAVITSCFISFRPLILF